MAKLGNNACTFAMLCYTPFYLPVETGEIKSPQIEGLMHDIGPFEG